MTEKSIDLSVDIAGLRLSNPVIAASGTFDLAGSLLITWI